MTGDAGCARGRAPGPPAVAGGLLLHAILPTGQRLPAGLATLSSVEGNGLSGLVSPVGAALVDGPDREAAVAAAALAHHGLLCACRDLGEVLPIRFATVLADRDAVAALLARAGASLCRGLEAVAGADEFGVRIVAAGIDGGPAGDDGANRPSHPVEDCPAPAGAGRAWLQARQAARRDRDAARGRRAALAAGLVSGLAELARGAPLRSAGGGSARAAVADFAFLVPRAHTERFRDRLAAFARTSRAHGLTLEVSGPWPAYSFAAAVPARVGSSA